MYRLFITKLRILKTFSALMLSVLQQERHPAYIKSRFDSS